MAASFLSASLAAQPRDPAAADALFREGRVALKHGDFAAACDKFAASQHLDPGAGTLLNLATCEDKLGHLANAWEHLQEAIDLLAPANDDRLDLARRSYADVNKRLPHLVIRLATDSPPSTHVQCDGTDVDPSLFGFAQPMDPGDHLLAVKAPGHADISSTVHLDEAETRELTVGPGPALPETPSTSAAPLPHATVLTTETAVPAAKAPSRSPVLPLALGGIGVTGVLAGAVTGTVMVNVAASRNHACPDKTCVGDDAFARSQRLASEGKTLSIVTPVALGVGVAALATATFLALQRSGRSLGMAPGVQPWMDAHATGLSVVGWF